MKKLILLLLLITLPSYSYEFCSDKLPEGCIGYDEGIHHLETLKQNGQFYIKIIPQQGYDFYKKTIPYGTNSKQMYKDFDRAIKECMEERNHAFGLKDVDAYWDKANVRTEPQDISRFVNPTKIIY